MVGEMRILKKIVLTLLLVIVKYGQQWSEYKGLIDINKKKTFHTKGKKYYLNILEKKCSSTLFVSIILLEINNKTNRMFETINILELCSQCRQFLSRMFNLLIWITMKTKQYCKIKSW